MRRLAAALIGAALALGGASGAVANMPPTQTEGTVERLFVDSVPGGRATVAWERYRLGWGGAELRADGTWAWAETRPRWIDPMPRFPSWTATDASGNSVGVVRWNEAVKVYSQLAGGWQGAMTTVGTDEATDGREELAIALGNGGHAVALWAVATREGGTERRAIRGVDRGPNGVWSAAYELAPSDGPRPLNPCPECGDPSRPPKLAVDDAGNAVAIWESTAPGGTVSTVWAARPVGGAWSAPRPLAAPAGSHAKLELDASGTAIVGWSEGGILHVARRAGDSFPLWQQLGPGHSLHALVADELGGLFAVWVHDHRVLGSTSRNGGPWSAPTDLTALVKPPPPEPPVVTPPLLEGVALSRTTLRRPVPTVLRFRLGSAGEVKVIVQRRGRGKAIRGMRVAVGAGEHRIRLFASRPLPPGRYTVRVRVTAEGQAPVTATKRLVVRPA